MSPIWRARHLEAQIGRQHAPGRQHRRDARHDDPRQIELARDVGRVQPGRAAEREQREPPRIDAAAHRDEPHALGHVGVDDAVDAARPPRRRSTPSAAAMPVDGALGRRAVEPAPPPRKLSRVEIAEHQIGVGHGGVRCRRGRSRRGPAPRRRFPARHAGCRRHRPARSSRRRRRCWRCRGCSARSMAADPPVR